MIIDVKSTSRRISGNRKDHRSSAKSNYPREVLSDIIGLRTASISEAVIHLGSEQLGFRLVLSANCLPETARSKTVHSFDKERVRDGRGNEVLDFGVRLIEFFIFFGGSSELSGLFGRWTDTEGFGFDGRSDRVIQQMR